MAEVINTSGKRKTAVARAVVSEGSGKIRVNSVPIEAYVPELAKLKIMEPVTLAPELFAKVDIDCQRTGWRRHGTGGGDEDRNR